MLKIINNQYSEIINNIKKDRYDRKRLFKIRINKLKKK